MPNEPWVKDREWAIANQLNGFAGYPLISQDRVIGVLVCFSHQAMAAEFLEVLQVLCMAAAVGLDAAIAARPLVTTSVPVSGVNWVLSEWLATILAPVRLTLVGTEQHLAASPTYLVLRTAERLSQVQSQYCRLVYESDSLTLEAIVAPALNLASDRDPTAAVLQYFRPLQQLITTCQGTLQVAPDTHGTLIQVKLSIPYAPTLQKDGEPIVTVPPLSDREQEILELLGQGHRDRDIAEVLHISQSTVKFHINNSITKLKAKNRYQAVYEAAIHGWI